MHKWIVCRSVQTWLLNLVDFRLEHVTCFEILGCLFASFQLWVHLDEHFDHGLCLEGFRDSLCFLAALRAVLLLVEPRCEAAAAEGMEAWRQLDWLVEKLVAYAALMLLRQLGHELLAPLLLCFRCLN